MAEILIQGILCHYREKEFGEEVLYENLPQDEQYFRRQEHPFSDDELIAIAAKELKYDGYATIQKQFVDREKKRFKDGVYAYINGILRFIPGAYYCYLNYWTLEHGEKPDYREDDRLFFIFHEYLRLETGCLGITRGKGRRQGATSIGTFFMWFVAGREEYKNCGLTSYNDTIAQEVFQKMFMYGFKAMLPCFQEPFDSDSENFVRFVDPVEKKKKGVLAVKRAGLNSYVDYKPNTINSYDSGRQSYNVPDEAGKRMKVDINSYWSKLYKTFLVGRNKVGFGYLPTTVNKATEGGENFKIFWKNANQFAINKTTGDPTGINTSNRCVRYFVPATYCYDGCIDKFGNSIVDNPSEPIMGNDGKMITEGSKVVIMREREMIIEKDQIMEHRRDYPLDEYDMFAFETGDCQFNEDNIKKQIYELELHPVFLRQQRLVKSTATKKGIYPGQKDTEQTKISNLDDAKGGWFVFEPPNKPNHFQMRGTFYEPLNKLMYQIGVDTTQDRIAVDGSNPCILVFKRSCIIEGKETGNYPVAIWISPTRLDIHFDEEVLKACMWYGCTANYEIDRRTDFYRYFCKENGQDFLEWTPRIAQNPLKKKLLEYGTRSGDPFQLAQQLQVAKMYVDGTDNEVFNGHVQRIVFPTLLNELLRYDHLERTKSDQCIALFMALLPVFGDIQMPIVPQQVKALLRTYKIEKYA